MTPDAFRLILKIRALFPGDALDFGEYKLVYVVPASGSDYYAIYFGAAYVYRVDVRNAYRRDSDYMHTIWTALARWLTDDGMLAKDATHIRYDADALRLCSQQKYAARFRLTVKVERVLQEAA